MSAIVSKTSAMSLKAEDAQQPSGSPITFRISSSASDKAKDTLNVDDWKLDEWNTNPVVLWMHDNYSPPIARGLKAWVEDEFLKSQAVFASAIYPLAGTIEGLIRGDFLRAASVGFVSDDYSPNEDGGLDFHSQTLREWSVVTIGCNGDALVEAKSAGIDTEPLREWAHHTLERLDGSGVWVPKTEADRIVKALGPIKTFSIPAPRASEEIASMKTLTLIVQVPEAKSDEAKADVEKKIKNHGGALLKSETADAANDDLASHIKALGAMCKDYKAALDAHAKANDDLGGHVKAFGDHLKALKDADGDDDGDKAANGTVTKSAAHKLSTAQMKRAKAAMKAASDMIAAHHASAGAPDGEPDGSPGDNDADADKAAADVKRKAQESEIAALLKEQKELRMRLTGKVS